MVSYSSVLHDLCGDEVYRVFCEPNSSPCELGAAKQPPVSAAASSSAGVLNEANVNSLLLATLEQFKDQAALEQFKDQGTDRLLLFALERYEDSGTTQQEDTKKTPATMSTKHFAVNDHHKQI